MAVSGGSVQNDVQSGESTTDGIPCCVIEFSWTGKVQFLRNVPWLSEVTAGGAPAHKRCESRKRVHMRQSLHVLTTVNRLKRDSLVSRREHLFVKGRALQL